MAKAALNVLDGSLPSPGEVQFNPSSLRLVISNHPDPKSAASTARQFVRSPSLVLSVDLVFDTADEGTTEQPRSVREKTRPVENLIMAQPASGKSAPPRVEFVWGDVQVQGFVTSASLDLELFSTQGTPLRAKIALSIQGQDPREQANQTGPGANKAGDARPPGKVGLGAVGGVGFGLQASLGLGLSASAGFSAGIGGSASLGLGLDIHPQVAIAIGGESAAEFAQRVGMDPSAWRGIATGQLEGTLSLGAGAEVGFDASISATAGVGAAFGVQAARQASPEASFGLTRSGPPASAGNAGFSLSAAGGVAAALSTVSVVTTESAKASTLRAFDRPSAIPPRIASSGTLGLASVPSATAVAIVADGGTPMVRPMPPEQPRPPLALRPNDVTRPGRAASAPILPRPDPRALAYGFGIPLRPRIAAMGTGASVRPITRCVCQRSCACGTPRRLP